MTVRKVKDPARRSRTCYQWGFSGRVYCGASAMQHAVNEGREARNAQHASKKKRNA